MLGKQVAGSPWSNARTKPHQLSACSQAQRKHINAKKDTKYIKMHGKIGEKLAGKNMDQEPFGHTLRRESNPGFLSEARGAADRQKC